MAKKSSKGTRIQGDVNIKNGDVVAGDKTVIHGDKNKSPTGRPPRERNLPKAKYRELEGNLEVEHGDVVFGDKIIKFFQDNLNIYLFKDVKQLALFLIVLLLVFGGIAGGIWFSEQPQKMTGDFNIVVARFGEIQPNGDIKSSARAEAISSTIFNFLDSEYKSAGLKVIISHKNIPLIIENTQAEKLALQINADVIIYGNVYFQGDKAEFSPRFYIANLPDTDELTGQNELAYPIPFHAGDIGTDNTVNSELRARTAILVNFTKGLIYFYQKDLDDANNAIQSAIQQSESLPKPFAGQEVLYLIAARIRQDQKDYQNASDELDKAFSINPQYARAYLARGNIYYLQAITKNYDDDLLSKAYHEYMLAYQAPNQPEGAYIPSKAHTGLGNVLVIQAQKTDDPALFAEAIENYFYVVHQYEKTHNSVLLKNVTIAYFGLGAAYERQGQTEQALKMYETAYELTKDQEFKTRIEAKIQDLQHK